MSQSISKSEFIKPHFLPLGQIVTYNAAQCPDNIAMTMDGQTTSWTEFDLYTNQIANGLLKAGIEPADRVAYLGKTTDAAFQIMHGTAKVRGVFTPINWRLAPPEIAYILKDARAKVLFVSEDSLPLINDIVGQSGFPEKMIIVQASACHDENGFQSWRERHSSDPTDCVLLTSDVVLQLYTSGTTGRPKGALITQEYVINAGRMYNELDEDIYDMRPGEEFLNYFPIFHTSGSISSQYAPFSRGCGIIIFPEFDPQKIFECIDQRSIPLIGAVPTMLQAFLSDPTFVKTDFGDVRYIMYGAAPMPIPLRDKLTNLVGCRFAQGYGATESLSISLLSPADHETDSERLKSVGRAMPGVEIKIVDPNGAELPVGEIGEIAVRSPIMAQGYWQLPDATAAAFKDGWYLTGDGGRLDEGGYLFLKERIKDLIISGGENIYPGEVENVLYAHPSINSAAVVAVADKKWGEVPFAFIIIKDGAQFDRDSLQTFVDERLARYKQPKYYECIDALPLNAAGKILKKDLREMAKSLLADRQAK